MYTILSKSKTPQNADNLIWVTYFKVLDLFGVLSSASKNSSESLLVLAGEGMVFASVGVNAQGEQFLPITGFSIFPLIMG